MMGKKHNKLYSREKLVNNLLIIDGITRAGKLLLGNLISCFDKVERYQYLGLLEHIPALAGLGLIENDVAAAIIKTQIDNFSYDYTIGRVVNFRFDDKSSVFNSPNIKYHLKKLTSAGGDEAVNIIKNDEIIFPFVLHDVFSHLKIFFNEYDNLKVIHINRHPVDLIYSWYTRGWGRRFGTDVKDFSLSFDYHGHPVPWFAIDWADEYIKNSEMERVIKSIHFLINASKKAYEELSLQEKEKILTVTYEDIIINSETLLHRIGAFLSRGLVDQYREILIKENLPSNFIEKERMKKIDKIKSLASDTSMTLVNELVNAYEGSESAIR